VRFAAQLGFSIEQKTKDAIMRHAGLLAYVAKERIRDEFFAILRTSAARKGVELLHELGVLLHMVPELEEGIDMENRPAVFTIWEHNLKALEYGAAQGFSLDVRIAALLHDVGKPRARGPKKRGDWTFYGHDVIGGRMAAVILTRLRCPHVQVEKISTLIRWHLFKYELDEDDAATTDASIRRLVRRVGSKNMSDLVLLRICDRMGMGVPKPIPYRLRHFQFRVEKILREEEAPTPKSVSITGEEIMGLLNIGPGHTIGRIKEVLLQEIMDDPEKNMGEYLRARVSELGSMSEEELIRIATAADEKVRLVEDERIASIKSKYYVK
jgi:tRNA nucleotidyltransferase (CCA-adding enzyme)